MSTPTRTARTPWILLLTSLLLAAGGCVLLSTPNSEPSSTPRTAAHPAPPYAAPHADAPRPHASQPPDPSPVTASSSPPPTAQASEPPPHGEGPAGDTAIQQLLETSWHPDLPDGQARQLLKAGRSLLRADATGIGRSAWPTVFDRHEQAQVAPAFARFRIQAAIARKDGAQRGRAVVHLVWAAADRGGTYTDGRVSDLYFTSTTTKGATTWTPLTDPDKT